MMSLYFAPLACSLATRIALYEAGAHVEYIQVDTKLKQLRDGSDFYPVNPLGQVPVLRTEEGWLLTENTAILPYVADRFPAAQLAPPAGTLQRARLQEWLGFIGTELHKAVFVPLLDSHAPEEVKQYARAKTALRLGILQKHLAANDYLLDRFSVADAYLAVVLNWAPATGVDLAPWPAVGAYLKRLRGRASVAEALAEELALYREEVARHARR
ncbi:glutathione binding-like protein [Paraburkholderia phenazinium]|jgi:glutathione S-transferase|uniref:Glutathione S-transferase n=1 Tax=Paraburkholderia phenazinium TaxID=60549 RepID=A0A1G8GJQ3_9BURK|nr:glutathione binding-like protein [Paraburkholderia phenazinium]SDH94527.1 glutathione S-transferase [Paraburkholderia phenazinium]